jgi:hypothetical protein
MNCAQTTEASTPIVVGCIDANQVRPTAIGDRLDTLENAWYLAAYPPKADIRRVAARADLECIATPA